MTWAPCTPWRGRSTCSRGASEALWRLLNAPVLMGPAYAGIRTTTADTIRERLAAERFEYLMGRGRRMPLPDALAVAAGLGNRDIAERLYLSKRTVDSHIDHIFTKLGFSSRTQLVGWVLEEGNSAGD